MQECLRAASTVIVGDVVPAASSHKTSVDPANLSTQTASAHPLELVHAVAAVTVAFEPAEAAALNRARGGSPLTQVVCVPLDSLSAFHHVAPAVVPCFEYVHVTTQRRGACVVGS